MADNMRIILGFTCWTLLILIIGMAIGEKSAVNSAEQELISLSIQKTKLSIKLLNAELLENNNERH